MNGVDILSKTIANELLIKDGYLPKYILDDAEVNFLKNINSQITKAQEFDSTIPNSVVNILISNGETQMRIWNSIEEFIYQKTKKKLSELIVGTAIKYTKNPEVPIYTIQWILNRLYENGSILKLYNPGKFKLIIGSNVFFASSIKESITDCDIFLDFSLFELPLKHKMDNESIIFRF